MWLKDIHSMLWASEYLEHSSCRHDPCILPHFHIQQARVWWRNDNSSKKHRFGSAWLNPTEEMQAPVNRNNISRKILTIIICLIGSVHLIRRKFIESIRLTCEKNEVTTCALMSTDLSNCRRWFRNRHARMYHDPDECAHEQSRVHAEIYAKQLNDEHSQESAGTDLDHPCWQFFSCTTNTWSYSFVLFIFEKKTSFIDLTLSKMNA